MKPEVLTFPATRRRGGRPSAEQAGEVDRRILDAATTLFLRSGFDATSCDQVLALASAGKATLYARYANKEALFSAVVRRMVEKLALPEPVIESDAPAKERLRIAGISIVRNVLDAELIALIRVCISTAHRLPELSQLVDRMIRGNATDCIVRALAGPTHTPSDVQKVAVIAEQFIDMVVMPQQMRALVGDSGGQFDAAALARVSNAIDLLASAGLFDAFDTKTHT